MKIEIDVSGQIQQLNYDSALAMWKSDGADKSVFLKSSLKKKIIRKYKSQVINLIEKLHCILIYYCIKDALAGVEEIIICKDINKRRLKNLLPFLFKRHNFLRNIRLIIRGGKSKGHKFALKTFRKKKFASLMITKEMIENVLFEFKEK